VAASAAKETQMDNFQVAFVGMTVADRQWNEESLHGRRVATAEDFYAREEMGWHVPDLKNFLATCANAVRARWQLRASRRIAPMRLPA
jgi:hypothetical protein